MNWKLWAQGLSAAAIGGAASGFSQSVTSNGGKVNTSTGICAGVGALFTAVAYILRSPLTGAQASAPVEAQPEAKPKQ